jgi:hypothetical protein
MQTEESARCNSESPAGRVQDSELNFNNQSNSIKFENFEIEMYDFFLVRRQWALHEDEAFATRLQDEESKFFFSRIFHEFIVSLY